MTEINGHKIEIVINEIYDLFEHHQISGNEGAAIAGMILSTSSRGESKPPPKGELSKEIDELITPEFCDKCQRIIELCLCGPGD